MTCGIYKIENLINHKIYIGQSVEIEHRFQRHKCAQDDYVIHKALRKYGIENFSFTIIEECLPELLDEKENYWIAYYNSLIPNGYNMILGGNHYSGLARRKAVEQYSLDGQYIATYESVKEAAQKTNSLETAISACCHDRRNYTNDFQWKFVDSNKEIKKIEKRKNKIIKVKIIQQIDENNNIVNEFSSIAEAHRQTGISVGNIGECILEKRKTAGGFKWKRIIIEKFNKYV